MIITLTKADFSALNVGTLSTWHVFKSLDRGVTYEGVNFVNKDETFIATLTVAEGYELVTDGVVITMGGQTLDSNAIVINGNIITISIVKVTGNISIRVPTIAILPEVPEPDVPVNPTPDPEEPDVPVNPDPDPDIVINYALNTQINDNTGNIEGSNTKPRITTTSVLKVNEGDKITLAADTGMEFIAYAWADDAGSSYLGYVDCDPNDTVQTNYNWARSSFTFQATTKGSKSSGNFSYPVYIRVVFRPIEGKAASLPTLAAMPSKVTYNITGYMDDFVGSIRLSEATKDGINYKMNYRYDDNNGALIDNDQGYDTRAVWTTPVQVSVGDNIKLNNSNIKFLLYAYSNADEAGKDSNYLGYIDVDTSTDSGNMENWGQDFTFAADTVASKSSSLSYPIYVRGVFRAASGNNTPISLTDIVSNMEFTIADTTE